MRASSHTMPLDRNSELMGPITAQGGNPGRVGEGGETFRVGSVRSKEPTLKVRRAEKKE